MASFLYDMKEREFNPFNFLDLSPAENHRVPKMIMRFEDLMSSPQLRQLSVTPNYEHLHDTWIGQPLERLAERDGKDIDLVRDKARTAISRINDLDMPERGEAFDPSLLESPQDRRLVELERLHQDNSTMHIPEQLKGRHMGANRGVGGRG